MFVPLFNKSNYSLLSSLLTIDNIISYAKENNLTHIALTDINMFGVMEFIHKCEKENIIPIVGLELNLPDFSFVLLAEDYTGYQNLMKLSTIQSERLLEREDIEKYNKNVIAIIPFIYKEYYSELKNTYIDIYLGFTDKKEELDARTITDRIVFFRESLYETDKDSEYLNYLYYIRDGKTLLDDIQYDINNHSLRIVNINEYSDEEGINNTLEIATKCCVVIPHRDENLLPIYPCDDPSKYLFDLCRVGLSKRLNGNVSNKYKDRLLYELDIINTMGFANYFLVVYDFIKYAKKNHILVGPGRGSAAGSLVAYSLGITDIDPLQYDLLFERFLNPERKTMPDIDTDFPDDKRDEVIEYVKEKYGEKRVSGIITFGTLASKQAIRDTSRIFNIPLYKVDSLCKYIPTVSKDRLIDIYHKNESFRVKIDSDTSLQNMFRVALKIEGFPRHTSSHAAGIIMSRVDLDEVIPLVKSDGIYLTGYSMEYLEELGLLKMDFLALKNLTLISNILDDIRNIKKEEIDFNKIPLDDQDTLKIFMDANTSGIFQFESQGMKSFLKRLRPSSFEDIFAAIALYRPGAALNIDSYIKRKHGEEKITYLDPSLESVTKNTYGFLIYQEQIMQVASLYAGYTLGEADILRRAMSKKKVDLLKSEEEKFIEKSMKMNHTYDQAKKIFELILNFAGYGFNKSHSVVYSIIAYKMAYLKCHYPEIFFANLLTNVIGDEVKTNEYIEEAKQIGLEIEKPSISNSEAFYVIEDNKLIYPLSNIKGVGVVASEQIDKARGDSAFQDIYDCFSRLVIAGVGKKMMENLIYANLFREFGWNRATLIFNLDSLYNYAELTKDIDPSLVMKPEIEEKKEYDNQFLLEKEVELFGFYLSTHPTSIYKSQNTILLKDIDEYFLKNIDVVVYVEKIKTITTKKGDKMAFLTGSDETGRRDFTLFPMTLKKYSNIVRGNIIRVHGKVEKRYNEMQIIVDSITILEGD